jgi:hypothetical protein
MLEIWEMDRVIAHYRELELAGDRATLGGIFLIRNEPAEALHSAEG